MKQANIQDKLKHEIVMRTQQRNLWEEHHTFQLREGQQRERNKKKSIEEEQNRVNEEKDRNTQRQETGRKT